MIASIDSHNNWLACQKFCVSKWKPSYTDSSNPMVIVLDGETLSPPYEIAEPQATRTRASDTCTERTRKLAGTSVKPFSASVSRRRLASSNETTGSDRRLQLFTNAGSESWWQRSTTHLYLSEHGTKRSGKDRSCFHRDKKRTYQQHVHEWDVTKFFADVS